MAERTLHLKSKLCAGCSLSDALSVGERGPGQRASLMETGTADLLQRTQTRSDHGPPHAALLRFPAATPEYTESVPTALRTDSSSTIGAELPPRKHGRTISVRSPAWRIACAIPFSSEHPLRTSHWWYITIGLLVVSRKRDGARTSHQPALACRGPGQLFWASSSGGTMMKRGVAGNQTREGRPMRSQSLLISVALVFVMQICNGHLCHRQRAAASFLPPEGGFLESDIKRRRPHSAAKEN